MQLITITIFYYSFKAVRRQLFSRSSTYILYKVKTLSNMPKNLVIIHYLRRQYYETIYKPNAVLVFYTCCVFSTYHR